MDVFGWKDLAIMNGMGDGRRSPPTQREKSFMDAVRAQQNGQPASSVGAAGQAITAPMPSAKMAQNVGQGMTAVAQALNYSRQKNSQGQPPIGGPVALGADPWGGMRQTGGGLSAVMSLFR